MKKSKSFPEIFILKVQELFSGFGGLKSGSLTEVWQLRAPGGRRRYEEEENPSLRDFTAKLVPELDLT